MTSTVTNARVGVAFLLFSRTVKNIGSSLIPDSSTRAIGIADRHESSPIVVQETEKGGQKKMVKLIYHAESLFTAKPFIRSSKAF